MNLLVPYAAEWPQELYRHLLDEGLVHSAHFVNTSEPDGYWLALSEAWEQARTFIVLEADKFPAAGVLQRLWECEEPWCYVNPPMRNLEERAPYPSLSCAKFAERLMHLVPDLMQHVGELDLGLGAREWSRLDLAVYGLLEPYQPPHEHLELVDHRH